MGADEFELVREAFATNWIAPLGPHVDAFEKEFSRVISDPVMVTGGSPTDNLQPVADNGSATLHCAALSSGTAALHLSLRLLELKPDEEVFCSSLTFSASANPILYEKARPVFIDCERASWNMDPARLAGALEDRAKKGKLPRAVILVHLYGQSADLDAIAELCERYEVPLIEDAAEALGAVYHGSRASGLSVESSQLAGAFSGQLSGKGPLLSGSNPHNRSLLTNNSELRRDDLPGAARKVSVNRSPLLGADPNNQQPVTSNQQPLTNNSTPPCGVAPGTRGRMGIFSFNGNKIITTSGGGMLVSADPALIEKARFLATQARDPAPHYQHSEIGYNYRLSNVLAAIGRGQLRVLAERVNARRANCEFYQRAFAHLPGIAFMPEAPWGRSTRWLTCVLIDSKKFGADREAVRTALAAENIEARPVWKPMHLQPVFTEYDAFGGEVAEDLFNRGLCLPSGSNLTEADLQRVVAGVRAVVNG